EGERATGLAAGHAGKEALAHRQHGVADAIDVAAVLALVLAGAAVDVDGRLQAGAVSGGHARVVERGGRGGAAHQSLVVAEYRGKGRDESRTGAAVVAGIDYRPKGGRKAGGGQIGH
nr:hypothetical protein [Tanacetum cinerariifolium]